MVVGEQGRVLKSSVSSDERELHASEHSIEVEVRDLKLCLQLVRVDIVLNCSLDVCGVQAVPLLVPRHGGRPCNRVTRWPFTRVELERIVDQTAVWQKLVRSRFSILDLDIEICERFRVETEVEAFRCAHC